MEVAPGFRLGPVIVLRSVHSELNEGIGYSVVSLQPHDVGI